MLGESVIAATFFIGKNGGEKRNPSASKTNLSDYRNTAQERSCGKASFEVMAELKRTGYAKRLWDAWKDFEKDNGRLSGTRLAALVEARIGRRFDDSKLTKIHTMKRRATVDEHYALAAELGIDPDRLAGQQRARAGQSGGGELDLLPPAPRGRPAKKRKEG
jgi:hypothetical protein